MIPFACLSGELIFSDSHLEISVHTLSAIGFTFRLAHAQSDLSGLLQIRLLFASAPGTCLTLTRSSFTLSLDESDSYAQTWRCETADSAFHQYASLFIQDFQDYTGLRLQEDWGALSTAYLGRPLSYGPCPSSYPEAKRMLHQKILVQKGFEDFPVPCGVCLYSPNAIRAFIGHSLPGFLKWYTGQTGFSHPLLNRLSCIAAGHPTCPDCMPDDNLLLAFLDQANAFGLHPCIVLPPARTSVYARFLSLVEHLAVHSPPELILNDFGMISDVSRLFPGVFPLTLGQSLVRFVRDPRTPVPCGDTIPAETSLHLQGVPVFLARFGILRAETSCCNRIMSPLPMAFTLTVPYYPVNTSVNCVLRAMCTAGDRGQLISGDCPAYCQDTAMLYPSSLPMLGIGNTLYGFDTRSLSDPDYLKVCLGKTGDRVLLDFPL